MAENNEQKKDFTELDPDQINLKRNGEPAEGLPQSGDPSQTAHWSGKPPAKDASAKLPEAEPDNMPGDTETLTKTIYQRY